MQSIRIELGADKETFLIDVVCDCGANMLQSSQTKEFSTKHPITPGRVSYELTCRCGRIYLLRSQNTHVHVNTVRR